MRKKNEKSIQQQWEEATLANNFIFQKVMQNPELCKKALEEILEVEIEKLDFVDYEKTFDIRQDSKAVRIDVYVKDGKNTVYNIEMQNTLKKDMPKRGRYYQDIIDLDLLEKGCEYKNLNKSIVIFICTFDYYGLGYYKYTFNNNCLECGELEYGDETSKIIVNTNGRNGTISEELKAFLDAINGYYSENEFSVKLKSEVERVKCSREFRREYMYWFVQENDAREEGREEGREEVIEMYIQYNVSENVPMNKIIDALVKIFQLEKAIAEKYYNEYSK